MKNLKMLLAACVISGMLFTTGYAATLKCTVEKVDETTVVLNCGDDAAKLVVGDKVKVKTAKKAAAAIEGC